MKQTYISSPAMLGKFIRSYRKKKGINQKELGKKAGITQETISNLENQTKRIRIDNLFRILSALNLDLILTDKKEDKNVKADW